MVIETRSKRSKRLAVPHGTAVGWVVTEQLRLARQSLAAKQEYRKTVACERPVVALEPPMNWVVAERAHLARQSKTAQQEYRMIVAQREHRIRTERRQLSQRTQREHRIRTEHQQRTLIERCKQRRRRANAAMRRRQRAARRSYTPAVKRHHTKYRFPYQFVDPGTDMALCRIMGLSNKTIAPYFRATVIGVDVQIDRVAVVNPYLRSDEGSTPHRRALAAQ